MWVWKSLENFGSGKAIEFWKPCNLHEEPCD